MRPLPPSTPCPAHRGPPRALAVSQPEIERLLKRFRKLDKDGSGSIDKDEFLQIPQIATNPLASRMIAIFDEDGGGSVDFQEFVAGLSAFSSRGGRDEKLRCECRGRAVPGALSRNPERP